LLLRISTNGCFEDDHYDTGAAMPNYAAPYERQRLELITRLIPRGDGRAVDIGCNEGFFCRALAEAGYEVVGFDIDPAVLIAARAANPDLQFRVGSAAEACGISPRTGTLCLEVIEHLERGDQADLLRDIANATAHGGWLLISTPGRYSAWSLIERARSRSWSEYDWWDPTHLSIMSARRFRRLIRSAGFRITRFAGYYFLPQGRVRPFGIEGPLSRLGFDLVALATKTQDEACDSVSAGPITGRNEER
jgi:2-polyprenyl-3-methyl-5-hydroxy-6-metoxy-1,4-benzoquinol methylase